MNFFHRQKKALRIAIVATIFTHIGILTITFKSSSQGKKDRAHTTKKRSKILLKFAKNQKAKQIVNSVKSDNQKNILKTKFLGKSDNFFHRETRSRIVDKYNIGAKGRIDGTTQYNAKTRKKIKKKLLKNLKLANLAINPLTEKMNKKSEKNQNIAKGTKHGTTKQRGVASNNDFIERLPLSDLSRLNTQESKYYGFYFRIRQKLEQFWGMTLQEKAKLLGQKGRAIASGKNLITNLTITLNKQGKIVGIKVLGSSGIKELDEAAIESFNMAGPFPNPPQELVKDGQTVIKWGFVVRS